MKTDAVINKLYPFISNESRLSPDVLLNLVKSISDSLSAEQRDSTLSVLREIVAKWQKETKGVVPFELEATFELVVKSVLEGSSVKVPSVSTRCLEQFGWFLCRRVAAVVPEAFEDISGAVVAASAAVAPAVVVAAPVVVVAAPVVVVAAPVVVAPAVVASVADDVSVSSVLDTVIEEVVVSVAATAATETVPLKPLVKEVVPEQVQPVATPLGRKTSNRLSMKSDRRE